MHRWPEIFLAGCSSAEPVSAFFRQNKCIKTHQTKQMNRAIKCSTVKNCSQFCSIHFSRKKEAKKETKEWASPMNIFIRFAEALASMHVSASNLSI
jgi:hypothetical protein